MKIRTAIFGVYVTASALGFAVLMTLVLRDVRLRYVESMRRTMGDTASFLATFAAEEAVAGANWSRRLEILPAKAERLRVFACDEADRVVFDAAQGGDVGKIYPWPMTGGGFAASENYTLLNVAEVGGELRVRAPVRREGKLLGWVGVGRPLASITEGVSRARWRLAAYAGAVAGVMLAAGWWLASRLTRSLERLTTHVQAVRDGRGGAEEALPQSRASEIAELTRAFGEMRTALEGKAYVERYTQALTHELKAPLSAIRGAAELLGEELPAADRARFLWNLRAETERIQGIVDRLLELAAIEARHGRVEGSELDLRAIAAEVVGAAEVSAEARGVALKPMGDATVRVRGERFLLEQAISNLVQNALAFTPRGGVVTMTVSATAGRAIVTVDDTGPGVPDYALARVGERFYSLPRPDTGRKSTGLGLSIVREIARLHGGEFALTNRAGGGSGARAELSLPAA